MRMENEGWRCRACGESGTRRMVWMDDKEDRWNGK